eukprot:g1349.t1
MLHECFGTLPVVNAAFAASFVAALSAANIGGRFFWSAASDALAHRWGGDPFFARKVTFGFMWGMGPLMYLATLGSIYQCQATHNAIWLYVFSGGVLGIMSSFGGAVAARPAMTGDLFGTKNVGVLTARQLSVVAPAAFLGPKISLMLREDAIGDAIHGLAPLVPPTDFTHAFGLPPDQLDLLVQQKTVTINRLMELVPPGTVDPTPFVYDKTLLAMAGLQAMAFLCNVAMRPVDPRLHIKEEGTRLQLQNELGAAAGRMGGGGGGGGGGGASPPPRGMFSMAAAIAREEGALALFKGTAPAVVRQWMASGIGVGMYQPVRMVITGGEDSSTFAQKILAASITGTLGQLVAAPADVIKVRLQADGRMVLMGQEPRYRGMGHALVEIPRTEGWSTFYKGLTPSLIRAALMYGTSCATYDQSKTVVVEQSGGRMRADAVSTHLVCSGISGFVAASVSSPLDVIKTRLISEAADSKTRYSGPIDCVVRTVRSEGITALYKGFTPTYLRLAPWQLVFFVLFEQVSIAVTGQTFTSSK